MVDWWWVWLSFGGGMLIQIWIHRAIAWANQDDSSDLDKRHARDGGTGFLDWTDEQRDVRLEEFARRIGGE